MAGGVINTGSHPKLLWPGIFTTWGQVYDQHAKEYTDLYDIRSSDKAYEQAAQVTPFGLAPVKAQGAPVTYDGELQGVISTYTHIAYALGFIVTYETSGGGECVLHEPDGGEYRRLPVQQRFRNDLLHHR
jgi:hypothetical protein